MRNDARGFRTDAIHTGEAEHNTSTPVESLGEGRRGVLPYRQHAIASP